MCKSVNILVFRSYQCCAGALIRKDYLRWHHVKFSIWVGISSEKKNWGYNLTIRSVCSDCHQENAGFWEKLLLTHFASVDVYTRQTYTRLSRNLVFVCVDRMTSISATCGHPHGRLTGFYARTSRLDTRQQWTSSLFLWMLSLYPRHVPLTDWAGLISIVTRPFTWKVGANPWSSRCVTAYDGMVSGEERRTHWTN